MKNAVFVPDFMASETEGSGRIVGYPSITGLWKSSPSSDQHCELASNSTVEGEATAVYLLQPLKRAGVKVTSIAMGIRVGSDTEYTDEITMLKVMEGPAGTVTTKGAAVLLQPFHDQKL